MSILAEVVGKVFRVESRPFTVPGPERGSKFLKTLTLTLGTMLTNRAWESFWAKKPKVDQELRRWPQLGFPEMQSFCVQGASQVREPVSGSLALSLSQAASGLRVSGLWDGGDEGKSCIFGCYEDRIR